MADGQTVTGQLTTGEESSSCLTVQMHWSKATVSSQENSPGVRFLQLHDFNYFVLCLLIKKLSVAARWSRLASVSVVVIKRKMCNFT